jgi:hypothetical protein
MVDIDTVQEILDGLAMELPQELYYELNGGILLLPEAKLSEHSKRDDLYILGQYVTSYTMGRYIVIYYGSFAHIFGHLSVEDLTTELRKTLHHEFTHHLERLAGDDDLGKEDQRQLLNYLGNK